MSKKAGMGEAYDAYKLAQELQSNLFHINHINESETKGEEAQIPWKISPSLVKDSIHRLTISSGKVAG